MKTELIFDRLTPIALWVFFFLYLIIVGLIVSNFLIPNLSFYESFILTSDSYYFDKYAIMNLCKIVYHNKDYNISGVYQKNTKSFWFPDLLVYKMNIQEYILFNPSHNLIYEKQV